MITPDQLTESREPPPEAPHLRGRVLLVEDNRFNQKVADSMLNKLGLEVETVDNGRDAVAHWAHSPCDVILMDCQMPDMDGFAATRAIREQERGRGRHIPIVALTANALEDDRQRCIAAGMDDYLSKPFSQKDLVAILGRWLSVGRQPPRGSITVATHRFRGDGWPSPAIDRRVLERLREAMGAEDFAELPPAYLGETRSMLDALAQADAGERRRLAHNIKSSSAALGALRLSELAKELEGQALEGELGDAAERISGLRVEFARVEAALGGLGHPGHPPGHAAEAQDVPPGEGERGSVESAQHPLDGKSPS